MKKSLAVFAAGLIMIAMPAMAQVDINVNLGTPAVPPAPVIYTTPAPVYVQPQPVYVQPRPVYVQPRTVYMDERSERVVKIKKIQYKKHHDKHGRGHGRGHDKHDR